MQIPSEKISIILLDLVISMQAELIVMRNELASTKMLSGNLNPGKIEHDFTEKFLEARKAVLANIKAHYLLEDDTEKLLESVLKKKTRKKK